MNSYNNKNHNNNINNNYNKTNSTKLGFDLIVISLVTLIVATNVIASYPPERRMSIQKKLYLGGYMTSFPDCLD